MFSGLLIKFIAGGLIVTIVSLLIDKNLPNYAGIVMTFPVITMVSFCIVPSEQVVSLTRSGLIGLGLTALFIIICSLMYQNGISRVLSIITASLVWFVSVFLIIGLLRLR